RRSSDLGGASGAGGGGATGGAGGASGAGGGGATGGAGGAGGGGGATTGDGCAAHVAKPKPQAMVETSTVPINRRRADGSCSLSMAILSLSGWPKPKWQPSGMAGAASCACSSASP